MKSGKFSKKLIYNLLISLFFIVTYCTQEGEEFVQVPEPEYFLSRDQTHNKFSKNIPPVLRVPSGAVIEANTEEASDEQIRLDSGVGIMYSLDFDPIHPLTGPVYIENAEPGDVLAVTLHKIEIGYWGWVAISPGFGFLSEEFIAPYLKTFKLGKDISSVSFTDNISIPLKPFPGVMGVAPDTEEMLTTIPPRANGGNMDNPYLTEGTTVYFPVFVEGALFSIGDAHAAQGMGEVCGTAIEAPMRIIYQVEVIKNKPYILEPHYETKEYYAVSAFGETLDEAAKKALVYMIDYLEAEKGIDRTEAYVLCSMAGDLIIAEVVDLPNMLVCMHIPKSIFNN
ncbi:acetamidase/formamidase family protein [candidate division KSB1 bacterium]